MGPSSTELEFILRMRDEATRVLNNFNQNTGQSGQAVEALAKRFDRLTKAARDFALVVGGGTLIQGVASSTLSTFAQYETRMVGIAKTTNQSAAEMAEFEVALDKTARALGGIQVADMQEVASVAGQLGISGSANLLKFSETLNKLATASNVVGEEGASDIARILNLTNTPIANVGKFADVLVHLGNNAAATEAEILSLATLLSQATSKFQLGYESILGLSSAGAELGFKPELFASVLGRSLNQLENAAVNNTKAMRNFSEATGITADEFQRMVQNDPTRALDTFLQVMDATNKGGGSMQQFLQDWNLYAEENQRVLGTLAAQYDLRKKNLDLAKQANAVPESNGALQQEYARTLGTLDTKYKDFLDTVTLAQKELGVAVKPAAVAVLEELADVIGTATEAFKSLDPWMQKSTLAFVTLAAAAVPAAAGFRLIGAALGFLGGGAAIRGVMGLGTMAPGILASARAAATLSNALGGLALGAGFAAAYKGLDILREKIRSVTKSEEEADQTYEGFVGTGAIFRYYNAISQITNEVLSGTMDQNIINDKANAGIHSAFDQADKDFKEFEKKQQERIKAANDAAGVQTAADGRIQVNPVKYLLEEHDIALQKLDTLRDQTAEVVKQTHALEALRKLSADQKPGDGSSVTQDELSRLSELLKVAERMADPFKQVTYELEKEQAAMGAITITQKNLVELEQARLDIVEKKGRILPQELKDLTQILQATQRIRALSELSQEGYDTGKELEYARERTSRGRQEVEINQRINDLIKDRVGEGYEKELEALREKYKLIADINALNSLQDRLDPVGTALRSFADDAARLRDALTAGLITMEQYGRLTASLDRQTLSQRNPLAYRVKDMRDELRVLSLRGEQAEIEQQVITETNALRDQGVTLDNKAVEAIRQYVTAVREANIAAGTGLQAWADAIGTYQEQVGRLQESTASAISDGLTEGFATGNWKQAAQSMLSSIGRQFIKTAVENGMQNLIKNNGWFGGAKNAAVDKGTSAADILAGISQNGIAAATATVNAGTVTVNGFGAGGPEGVFDKILKGDGSVSRAGSLLTGGQASRLGSTIDFKRAGETLGMEVSGSFEQMLRNAATRHGIDPDKAVQVANYEGGLTSWQQSKVPGRIPGTKEPSYGPMQMLVGGPGTGYKAGMGNDFMAQGFDPRNPQHAPQYFDFAMRNAKQNGWSAWYGARDNGIGKWEGINRGAPQAAPLPNVDTSAVTNSIQQIGTSAQAAQGPLMAYQQAQTMAGSNNQMLASSLQQTGTAAQTAGNNVQQMNTKLQTTTPSVGTFGSNVGGLQGPLSEATGAAGGFGQGIAGLLQSLMGGIGNLGGGGGFGGILSLFTSFFKFHEGGRVGGGGALGFAGAGAWANAPKFHSGGGKGLNNDEYRALLKKNERVLTESDDKRNMEILKSKGGRGGGVAQNVFAPNIPITVQASGNMETDKKMREQLALEMDTLIDAKMYEFVGREQRPGATLNKKRMI